MNTTAPATGELPALTGNILSMRANYVSIDLDDETLQALQISLMGQVVSRSGWGAYASLPLAYASIDDTSETTLGGLEVGGVYTASNNGLSSIARFGIILPTGPDFDDPEKALPAFAASYAYLPDLAQVAPSSTWIRLTYSPILRQGAWLASADVGIDVPIMDADIDGQEIDLNMLARINLAFGTVSGQHQFLIELNNLYSPEAEGDELVHTIGASYRYLGQWEPFLSVQQVVGLPENDVFDVGLGVSLGVATRL